MRQEANSISEPSFKRRNTPKVPKKISEDYLTNAGKFYLERFPASTEQFRRVFTRRIRKSCQAHPSQLPEPCFESLEKVIAKFQSVGFLDDAGYAGGLSRSLKNRGWPRGRIIMRLKEKGISAELIETVVEDASPDDDFRNALVWIKRKKLGAYATKEKPFEKALASLGRAGFDYNSASRALALSKEDIEEFLKD